MRNCAPVPHDLVQVDQAPNFAATTQSIGHAWALQWRASEYGWFALPPHLGAMKTRSRFCVPGTLLPMHDLVQVVHGVHSLAQRPSTGHGAALQPRVSAECGHASRRTGARRWRGCAAASRRRTTWCRWTTRPTPGRRSRPGTTARCTRGPAAAGSACPAALGDGCWRWCASGCRYGGRSCTTACTWTRRSRRGLQSTSHGAVLQLRVFSRVVGHATPPKSALTVIERCARLHAAVARLRAGAPGGPGGVDAVDRARVRVAGADLVEVLARLAAERRLGDDDARALHDAGAARSWCRWTRR